jgi:catechol 2,3-dioxygenase-like lactoylglutathione lyase family enzyme
MIIEFAHTTLLVRDLDTAVAAYHRILGQKPDIRGTVEGLEYATFSLGNAALRLACPTGPGTRGQMASARLNEHGEGLLDLVFRVDDAARTYRRLRRLSLSPEKVSEARDEQPDKSWPRTGLPLDVSCGIPISFREGERRVPAPEIPAATVTGIDLLVVATARPERAMALYGARLGLPLVFDQVNAQNNSRLMQFQCGDTLIEVIHRPAEDKDESSDRLWGIGWRVSSAEAVRERLARAGLNVSDVKDGAKRGTRVFTIRNRTCNVPTLVVQHVQIAS